MNNLMTSAIPNASDAPVWEGINAGVSGTLTGEFNRISDFEYNSAVPYRSQRNSQSYSKLTRVLESKNAQLKAMTWMSQVPILKSLISLQYLEELEGEISGYEYMRSRGVVTIPRSNKK